MAPITVNVSLPPLVPLKPDAKDQNWAQKAWANSWEASKDIARVLGTVPITFGVLGVWLLLPGAIGPFARARPTKSYQKGANANGPNIWLVIIVVFIILVLLGVVTVATR